MKIQNTACLAKVVTLLVVVSTALLLSSCVNIGGSPRAYKAELKEQATDKLDLNHSNYVRRDMKAMAVSVNRLLVLDTDNDITDQQRYEMTMRELDRLDAIATLVNGSQEVTNYSIISPYMGSFLHDVSMAKEYAMQSPPDYQPATWLIKSCLHCHQSLEVSE